MKDSGYHNQPWLFTMQWDDITCWFYFTIHATFSSRTSLISICKTSEFNQIDKENENIRLSLVPEQINGYHWSKSLWKLWIESLHNYLCFYKHTQCLTILQQLILPVYEQILSWWSPKAQWCFHLSEKFSSEKKNDNDSIIKDAVRFCDYTAKYKVIWGLCRQKQISQAGISNCIPQNTVGCNSLSLPEIPGSHITRYRALTKVEHQSKLWTANKYSLSQASYGVYLDIWESMKTKDLVSNLETPPDTQLL